MNGENEAGIVSVGELPGAWLIPAAMRRTSDRLTVESRNSVSLEIDRSLQT